VENAYVTNANHDDFFQSWSLGGTNGATVGLGTVYRVTVRGNTFISQTDSNQPFASPPQGIGCFDGMFEDWVVENNLIVTKHFHGIAFYGAINCRIVNNTAVENPMAGITTTKPWIYVTEHKVVAGADFPVSTNNLVRNNISAAAATLAGATADHNIITTSYAAYFVNPPGLDYSLSATSPAVGAGSTTNAPAYDIVRRYRSVAYDVGAYEYFTPLPVTIGGLVYTPPGQFAYTVCGAVGQNFVVQFSGDLLNWSPLLTNTLAQSCMALTNTVSPPVTIRFYRVMLLP
jgi:parallel beta-helix repeat protein